MNFGDQVGYKCNFFPSMLIFLHKSLVGNEYFRIKLLLFQTSKELINMIVVSLDELTSVSDLHADK